MGGLGQAHVLDEQECEPAQRHRKELGGVEQEREGQGLRVRHPEQLGANLAATSLDVPDEVLDELTALTAPPTLYPQWMIQRQAANRVV